MDVATDSYWVYCVGYWASHKRRILKWGFLVWSRQDSV